MAVGPVILISGVGLLLLSMTNRFGRVVDRARHVSGISRTAQPSEHGPLHAQLEMLRRRAKLLRTAITLAVLSVLMSALLVMTIFITAVTLSEVGSPIVILFLSAMSFLIAALIVFLQDLNLSLAAMNLEIALEKPSLKG
jgi:hypothetical protein